MQIIEYTGSSVAGNVTTTNTANEDQLIDVMYGQVVLTTDATVANRRVVFKVLDDSSNVVFDSHSGTVVAASQSDQHHEFMGGIFRETSFIGGALQVPIPIKCILAPGYSFQIVVENGKAGDSYDYAFVAGLEKVAKNSVLVSA